MKSFEISQPQYKPFWTKTKIICSSVTGLVLIGAVVLIIILSVDFEKPCDTSEFKSSNLSRIIDGEEAVPHSYPWIISLQYFRSHVCGGSIIDKQWILTAGHCIKMFYVDLGSYSIVVGLHDLTSATSSQRYTVIKAYTLYKESNLIRDDVALLKLDRPIQYSKTVIPIELSQTPSYEFKDKCLVIAGWGSMSKNFYPTYPNKLQETYLRSIESSKCIINGEWDKDATFCLKSPTKKPYTMACSGDSGGPLMSYDKTKNKWFVEGIASYVVMSVDSNKRTKCLPDHPGFYTKVYNYKEYIKRTISTG